MIELDTKQLQKILDNHQDLYDVKVSELSTDSRTVDEHTLFVALAGNTYDGHHFVKQALESGAPLVITEHEIEGVDKKRVLVVLDTVLALGKIAHYNRLQFKGTVIGLTGSSGKTTTKEELKAALSMYAPTYATTANHNNHIGVPRSLLDIDMNAKYAVIEMGMSGTGEIDYLSKMTEPNIALVTNVYPMHIEQLGTLENIAYAKAEIFGGVRPDGIGIYNEDTAYANVLKNEIMRTTLSARSFGKNHHADVKLELQDESEHCFYNAWAVLAVIEALGLDLAPAVKAINTFTAPEGRGKRYHLDINGKRILLIDSSYSGGPDATILAVQSLGQLKGRKIAVIGKMAELGDYTKEAHVRVGKALADNKIDVVIGVCEETKDMLVQLPKSVEQYYFDNIDGLVDFLKNKVLQDGDSLLIKGSHYSSQVYKVADSLKV